MSNPWWFPRVSAAVEPTPWLHPAVVAYLETLLRPEYTVIEHGSGGSTLWLASRVAFVYSVEDKPEWYETMKKRVPRNVRMKMANEDWLDMPIADLLLIDGEPLSLRWIWLCSAHEIVKPGGIVVLDNANRPEYADARQHLRGMSLQNITFDMNPKHAKYLVTEFYLMPGGEREWI